MTSKLEEIRQKIVIKLSPSKEMYIVDSMPIEVCKLSRAYRSKICQDKVNSKPNFGFCVAQNMRYFGYKLHAVCTRRRYKNVRYIKGFHT